MQLDIIPGLTRDEYVEKIVAGWNKTRDGILEVGRWLIEAKTNLEHGDFLPMIEEQLPFSNHTADRLMAIASCPYISNVAHGLHLPPSWRASMKSVGWTNPPSLRRSRLV